MMPLIRPKHFFRVAGHDEGFMPLNAFDHALLQAGIGDTNLVRMSSILPPHATEITPITLPAGALIPVAYAAVESSTPGETIAAAVAVAIPKDHSLPGLIMEHHGVGTAEEIEKTVRLMGQKGFEHRKRELLEIRSISSEHTVIKNGACFAGIVLWDNA